MLKRLLLAVAVVGTCSTGAIAQDNPDVFVTFGQGSEVTNTSQTLGQDAIGTTGTGFVFVTNGFDFDGVEVDLASSLGSVANITSANLVNSSYLAPFSATRFNNADVDLNSNGVLDGAETGDINIIPASIDQGVATFQASNINQQGIASGFAAFDGGFDTAANAFLLGTFEFDIVGAGTAEFALRTTDDDTFAGPTGFLTIPEGVQLSPVFGSASLTVEGGGGGGGPIPAIPEPSSAILLALGFAGFAARRRR